MPMQSVLARMDPWPAWQRWSTLAPAWIAYLGVFVALLACYSIALRDAALVLLLVFPALRVVYGAVCAWAQRRNRMR
jgi:hypothetical protein